MRYMSVLAFLTSLSFVACSPVSTPIDIAAHAQTLQTQAAQGDAWAQNRLGALYQTGEGVPQDFTKAGKWYERAAAQGNAVAQHNLGWLYAQGQGVPLDYVRGYMWSDLAATGLPPGGAQKIAARSREKIVLRMTPAQIAEAQRLTQQCQERQLQGC